MKRKADEMEKGEDHENKQADESEGDRDSADD